MSLEKDPINLIITGVGGQGNILISRLLGQALIDAGYLVTIGETYGATQRGGSVASHVRISREASYSPLTPEGSADVVLGLEPLEALRMLTLFGNRHTAVVTNTHPVHTVAVAMGEAVYPRLEELKEAIGALAGQAWYVDASKVALALGAPLLTNIVMAGALVETGLLPVKKSMFTHQLAINFEKQQLKLNLKAFEKGLHILKE